MRGSDLIENPFSKILKIQDRMFQVKRIIPESSIKINTTSFIVKLNIFFKNKKS